MADLSPGLRERVLAGGFFGQMHEGAAADVAAFLVSPSLSAWFGASRFQDEDALREAIDRDIARIDALIDTQLSAVLRHERLARLEGSWRGLRDLSLRIPPGSKVKLRLLQVRWAELARDFERAVEFDQSNLFRAVYEEEFGRPGGEPFGLLLADFQIRPMPSAAHPTDDISCLSELSSVAAAAFAPLCIALDPEFFALESYRHSWPTLDFGQAVGSDAHRRWRSLRQREDARFLSVMFPRILARPPWADSGARADGFRPSAELGPQVWTSPVYAMGAVAMRAFARFGWPADLRGAAVGEDAQGGVVDALPSHRLGGDAPGAPPRPPVEIALTDLQERQAVDAGLLPLLGLEGLPEVAFAASPSVHQPPRMTREAAEANQQISTQFNAILCVSRFAHCVKVMGRDMVGAFRTPEEVERQLQRWLTGFTNSSGSAVGETAARYPLRSARVEVREQPGRPGVYGCVLHLQPHYQLDEVGAAFRLVTDLTAPGATT